MDSTQQSSTTNSSASSAIDIPVPSLLPSPDGRNSFARRRLSWGRVESGQDPLRRESDIFPMNDSGPSSRPTLSIQPTSVYSVDDDPFVSPTQVHMFRASTETTDYDAEPSVYTNHSRAGNS